MHGLIKEYSPYLYAALRIVSGLLFAVHGSQKILGIPASPSPMPLDGALRAAGVIELVGGLLIALGLFAGYVAFVTCGEMAFAYFMVHAPRGPWPILNQGELAILYCFIFLYIAARGSGVLSLDRLMGRLE